MTMTVYHVSAEARHSQWLRCNPSVVADFEKNFEKVAVIDGKDDINLAFQLTNSIDTAWWENEGVTKGSKEGYRSTSVGDIVKLSDGTFHMVDGSGWVVVDPSDPVRMKVTGMIKEAAFQVEYINSKHFGG